MKNTVTRCSIILVTLLLSVSSRAGTLYWDSNGTTAGAGATPTGTWGSSAFWSTSSAGTATPAAWVSGSDAVFSAGSDAVNSFNVTLSGTQTAASLTVEEGTVNLLTSGAVALGAGSVTVNPGATLSIDSSGRFTASAGATLNLNGSTMKNVVAGNAGSFIPPAMVISVGASGGTLSFTTANILNIIQTGTPGTTISGPGGITKIGAGVLAVAT